MPGTPTSCASRLTARPGASRPGALVPVQCSVERDYAAYVEATM